MDYVLCMKHVTHLDADYSVVGRSLSNCVEAKLLPRVKIMLTAANVSGFDVASCNALVGFESGLVACEIQDTVG